MNVNSCAGIKTRHRKCRADVAEPRSGVCGKVSGRSCKDTTAWSSHYVRHQAKRPHLKTEVTWKKQKDGDETDVLARARVQLSLRQTQSLARQEASTFSLFFSLKLL